MISHYRLLPALLALVFTAGLCGWTFPTLYGDTGLVLVPTADIMPRMNFEVGIDYTNVNLRDTSSGAIPVRFVYGIARGTEFYLLASQAFNDNGFNAYGGGFKVNLVEEDADRYIPGLSLGGRFTQFTRNLHQNLGTGYLTTSTTLYRFGDYPDDGYRVRVHFGAEYDNFSNDLTGSFFYAFAGMSFEHSHGGPYLVVDYVPQLNRNGLTFRDSTVSGVIRIPFSDTFAAEFGATRPFISQDTTLFAGITYHFGDCTNWLVRDPLLPPLVKIEY